MIDGTILIVATYSGDPKVRVILPVGKGEVIEWLLRRVEENKGWASTLFQGILRKWPTLPIPEHPKKPVDLPIVFFDSTPKVIRWTTDGWDTFSERVFTGEFGRGGSRTWDCRDDLPGAELGTVKSSKSTKVVNSTTGP